MISATRLIFLAATLVAALAQAAPVSTSASDVTETILNADEVKPHTGPVVPSSAVDGVLEVVTEVTV
ncbi:uncharacterized protein CTRU02_209333 [Colletotrichum truncatum]|uniref:Uncharacterized protein n=1 Tax=Colletotrichum truncatum TaxID=5467 RepID=A0ACC3YUC0_COLTU|nr:uncharacterized protein CTRU02_08592 [Colletotrichum truncatum]KAF6789893.1 hypothetical protein CTRU02_08592 [Colletotrichum truncatum]